ncbi:MAG TPA: hypothetical protein VGD09_13285 [Blastococcus sp.]|jgi:hypothetical protein
MSIPLVAALWGLLAVTVITTVGRWAAATGSRTAPGRTAAVEES